MQTVAQVSEGQLLALFMPVLAEHNERAADVRAELGAPGALVLGPGDDSAALDLRGGLTGPRATQPAGMRWAGRPPPRTWPISQLWGLPRSPCWSPLP